MHAGIPPFKTPTLNKGILRAAEITRDGYRPKMLLYTLDKLFFVYAQIRDSPQDERASADKDEHPDPGGGLKVARIDALRCRHAKDNHRPRPPHMPSRCPHGATLLPCATARCYCSTTVPHDAPTTPRVASAVNVPPPMLDQEEVLEDNFQTQHMPVCHVKR